MNELSANLPADPTIRRILVIKWSAMGDLVISTAIMEDIWRAFPNAELHLNTLPPWDRLLFASDERFARVFTIDLKGQERGWRGIWHWLREVNAGRYDLIVDLQSNDRSRMLLTLLRLCGRRVKYLVGNHRRFPYTVAPGPHPPHVHAFVIQQRTLAACGIPSLTGKPMVRIPARQRERVARFCTEHGLAAGRYVVFLPGSQAAGWLKRWGAARYAELARLLMAAGLGPVVLVGGKDEDEECRRIQEQVSAAGVVNLCGQTEVLDIIPLCEGACCIVGNDTGTAHLAAAAGRPEVVICGPTDPRRVKPLGEHVVTLQAELDCINCYRKECEHHACMAAITPAMVYARLASLGVIPGGAGDAAKEPVTL